MVMAVLILKVGSLVLVGMGFTTITVVGILKIITVLIEIIVRFRIVVVTVSLVYGVTCGDSFVPILTRLSNVV